MCGCGCGCLSTHRMVHFLTGTFSSRLLGCCRWQEWDDELAKLAEYNARTCLYSRDECRNTQRYRNVGQNIARKSRPGNVTIDLERAISDLTNKWWQEYVDTNQTVMDDYRQVGEG